MRDGRGAFPAVPCFLGVPGTREVGGTLDDGTWGQWKAAFFYGPWQCSQRSMDSCRMECAGEGYALKGCMWLADLKLDWKGEIVPPVRVDSGGRLAIVHCCCDYPSVSVTQNRILREQRKNQTKSLRKRWGEKFGEWPMGDSEHWPGHHLQDRRA
jgi:hypothetical protein